VEAEACKSNLKTIDLQSYLHRCNWLMHLFDLLQSAAARRCVLLRPQHRRDEAMQRVALSPNVSQKAELIDALLQAAKHLLKKLAATMQQHKAHASV
jgi:hypothetical protein